MKPSRWGISDTKRRSVGRRPSALRSVGRLGKTAPCWLLILALPGFILVAGCEEPGPAVYPVSGVVTYQGKPLPLGSVMFVPQEKHLQAATAAIDAEGRYQLDAGAGQYLVQIQMAARLRGQPAPGGEGAKLDVPEVDWLIPDKYGYFQSSGLKVTVEPKESNEIDFPLK